MGEMRIDLHHLLEDLRDAYPGGVEETMALASLAAEPAGQHGFVSTFLARWGEALEKPGRRRNRTAG
jgi:hypothetical protein